MCGVDGSSWIIDVSWSCADVKPHESTTDRMEMHDQRPAAKMEEMMRVS